MLYYKGRKIGAISLDDIRDGILSDISCASSPEDYWNALMEVIQDLRDDDEWKDKVFVRTCPDDDVEFDEELLEELLEEEFEDEEEDPYGNYDD